MKIRHRSNNPLSKKARKGFRGYPVATIAFYGPDDQRASKVAVGIVLREGAEPETLEGWHSEDQDVRSDHDISREIQAFLAEHHVLSVVMVDGIIGCPHEEVIDYPEGEPCPQCPFWRNRDRFTGELIN
jgi:hypothetical protein